MYLQNQIDINSEDFTMNLILNLRISTIETFPFRFQYNSDGRSQHHSDQWHVES